MKTKSIIQQVFLGLLAIQLIAGCSNIPSTTVSLPSPVVSATTEPIAKVEVVPTTTKIATRSAPTSTPTKAETTLPPHTELLVDCPNITSQISKGLDDDLYLYLKGIVSQYEPTTKELAPIAQADLKTTFPPYLSPDGKNIYWVVDGTLILFDVDLAKITATSVLPEGSRHGAGWTNDGNIRLERLGITEDSDLSAVSYTILNPADFRIIKQQTYDLNQYPHLVVSVKYGGFVAVSPDGSKVLYTGLDQQVEHVFLYDVAQKQILWKSEEFNWVNHLKGGFPANTIWTKNGKWAIFAGARNGPDRIIFAISADGTQLKELAVLDSAIFEGELRSIQISEDLQYVFFPLQYTLVNFSESSAAVTGKGYLLDLEKGVINSICLKDLLFLNGEIYGDVLIYNVFNSQSKKVEVWVLEPKLWQTEKLFEFSSDGDYFIIGKNFAFR